MRIIYAAAVGFALDLMFGDPSCIPHPVVWMGKFISGFERHFRPRFPGTSTGQLLAGSILAVLLPLLTLGITLGLLELAGFIHPLVRFALECFWCWQALAVRDLKKESSNVYEKLTYDDLDAARKAVGRIVGRDTAALSEAGVTRAAVETVAESFSDGVIAPMFWMLIGGAPLALMYKAINTMDSMIAYKNEKYLYFGRCAAKLDDAANFLPSRIAAFLLIISAFFCKTDAAGAYRIWKRDRRCHASPNSAQTESVMAGALQVQLAGPAYYFGEYYDKPTIGDDLRPIVPEDILTANRMLYAGSLLALLFFSFIRFIILLF